jgi:phytoene desaturase
MKKKAIIIGSGLGGLATAIRLANHGLDVEIFEKLDNLGGRAQSFAINGFRFDSGPSVITAPFLLDELFSETGRKREDYFSLTPVEPYYRILDRAGQCFDYSGDFQSMTQQVERISPTDLEGSKKLLSASQTMYEKAFFRFTNRPFLHWFDMLKVAPELVRLRAHQSIYQQVAQYIQGDFLRQVFSVPPLLIGANPFTSTSLYALVHYLESKWGLYAANGGMGVIVQALARLVEELGGKVNLNAEVTEILVEGRKVTGVRLIDGSIHRADLIVSDADVAWTYKNLLPARARGKMTDRRLDRYQYSNAVFAIYFGTRQRYPDSQLSHHNILLGPRYRELIEDIFQHQRLPDDFLLFLNVPTLLEPALAPDGCEAFTVFAPVPNLASGIDWKAAARPFRDRLMQYLEQNFLPDLQANIIAEQVIDPTYFQNALNSYRGAAFSFAPSLNQSAWFRPHNRSEEFRNLYFCGAGTHPGAGIPGVLFSARIVEKLIVG